MMKVEGVAKNLIVQAINTGSDVQGNQVGNPLRSLVLIALLTTVYSLPASSPFSYPLLSLRH